ADALDRRDVELHRPDLAVHRLGAERDRPLIGAGGVLDPEGDGANRRAVQPGERLREAFRLGIEDEVDVALLVERDVLRAVARRQTQSPRDLSAMAGDLFAMTLPSTSPPRKRGSRGKRRRWRPWIPAFAGMTVNSAAKIFRAEEPLR